MPALVALLTGLAVAAALARPSPPVLAARPATAPRQRRAGVPPGIGSPVLACAVAAVALAVLLPWPAAGVAALAVGLAGPPLLGRLEPASARRDRERLAADLPLVLDLLGACLSGGAALQSAAAPVARAVGGPAGDRLARVATALAVGTPAPAAWALLAGPPGRAGEDDPLGPASRALSRSADAGTRVADVLARLAEDERRRSRSRGVAAARRAGVLAVAPLGLCHLPAFVLLAVVPVVAGLAGPLLTQL